MTVCLFVWGVVGEAFVVSVFTKMLPSRRAPVLHFGRYTHG